MGSGLTVIFTKNPNSCNFPDRITLYRYMLLFHIY